MNIINENLHCIGAVGRERETLCRFKMQDESLLTSTVNWKLQRSRKLKNHNIREYANFTKRAGKKHKTYSQRNANEPKVLNSTTCIKQERQCFIQKSKHREGSWKYDTAEYFWQNSRCLDSWWNTVSSVWYIFSIKTKAKE